MLNQSTRIQYRTVGNAVASLLLAIAVCLCLSSLSFPARADVVLLGDIDPIDLITWTSSTTAYIGKHSSGTLDITSGSDVLDMDAFIGYASGSTGKVTVDGAGSMWTNGYSFLIGHGGSGTLNITSGGVVNNKWGYIGYASGSTGAVTVDGTDSTLVNTGDLSFGYLGSGTLDITDGGAVTNLDGYIAYESGSNGSVTVDGANSTWTNRHLRVGNNGSGTLDITNGGTVSNHAGSIGSGSGSTGAVTVNGTGSTWTNSSRLYVGDEGSGTLHITNGGTVRNSHAYIGYDFGSTGEVTVDGTGSTWTNGSLEVGSGEYGGSGSGTLNITNGGAVSNNRAYIGRNPGSTGTVTVDGANSTWTNNNDLFVGWSGSGTLDIIGGAVTVERATRVTHDSGSSGAINFDGGTLTTGGLFCASDDLSGTGTINTHGLVSDVDLVFDATHGFNQIISINDNPGQNITINLNVDGLRRMGFGNGGKGSMSISDGVVLESAEGYIGYRSGSMGQVTVDGLGSTWSISENSTYYSESGRLFVGQSGSGTLNITGGGAVSNEYDGYIGYEPGSTGQVTVDGDGSTWTTTDDLVVGYSGSGTLNITGGGTVASLDGVIGLSSSATGEVTVDGVGSTWTFAWNLYVGSSGSSTLNITGGGTVSNSEGHIGHNSGSTGTVTVDGLGSTWTNQSRLYVGYVGGGTLNITDGGTVISKGESCIGHNSGSTSEVTVDGAGSTWINNYSILQVGEEGSGTLNVTGGGSVNSNSNWIGSESGSTGEVTVEGANSAWTASGSISVGHGGSGMLNITGGGAVNCDDSYIGFLSGSTGVVTVDGAGSTWTNSYNLLVGRLGRAKLNITECGLVSVSGTLTIDSDEDNDSFVNMSTGGMLALHGKADTSLAEYMAMIDGTDAIRYWDFSISGWASILNATYGEDYTLRYMTEGDLAGHTVLTVGAVPEPSVVVGLVGLCLAGFLGRARRKR